MSKATANKLLDLVRRSALIEEPRLDAFLEKTTAEHGAAALDNPNRLAELLIEADLITRWQADKLLAGKHKGFRLGKYKLLGQIGKGGMSSVYLAEHELMKRRVAVKVLPQSRVSDASYLERFRLEARAVAKLDDPHIVRAFDIDNEKNIHFIVMEYVEGQDLHQLVGSSGPLDYDTAADYIAQAAQGLQHAHEMGLVHRDIKPANFLLDKHKTVKLLDLGLAKLTEDDQASLTLANEENVLGTADYLAPEQALNSHEADSRSDIYSLGCTLYFLLAGHPPFPEGSISERLLKHQTTTPESILKARPDAPPSLVDACERMMAKKPDERFQTAQEVSRYLISWLANRGKKLGGKLIEGKEEGSGVGSGIFNRFALTSPTPPPSMPPSGSSETISASDRDTDKDGSEGRSPTVTEEEIGLAPLDDAEMVLGGSGRKTRKSLTDSGKKINSPSDVQSGISQAGPSSSTKSLVEEELFDPEEEKLRQKVAQRAEYNPLKPPGYVSPYRNTPWGLWLALGAGILVVLAVLFFGLL